MKRKYLLYALLTPVLGAGLLAANGASAHGLFGGFNNTSPEELASVHQNMFQEQAGVLGLSVEEIKNAWAEGKSLPELAKEKGISQEQLHAKLKEARTTQLKAQLKTLVDKGIITQAQADKRLQTVQAKPQQKMGKHERRGPGMGMFPGSRR